jgi:hypothetical protein
MNQSIQLTCAGYELGPKDALASPVGAIPRTEGSSTLLSHGFQYYLHGCSNLQRDQAINCTFVVDRRCSPPPYFFSFPHLPQHLKTVTLNFQYRQDYCLFSGRDT